METRNTQDNQRPPAIIDMHAHLSGMGQDELALRQNNDIYTIFSAGNPKEAARLMDFAKYSKKDLGFAMSCGVHPWNSGEVSSRDMLPYYESALFIGEIGMDSVWCDVPPERQRKVFREQLLIAAHLKKPVLLHTKGCEAEILEEIETFPYNICVHWYSGDPAILKEYIKRGCYFTLGPDGQPDIGDIPLDRLFVETDGLTSLQWLHRHTSGSRADRYPTIHDIPLWLNASMNYVAGQKAMFREDLEGKMRDNLRNFLLNR